MAKVCVGGTFDRLHKGHRALIEKAFEIAGKDGMVYIGLSNGDLVRNKPDCLSFSERKKMLEEFLKSKDYRNYKIIPICNRYGLTLDEDFDAIVVSEETFPVAEEINRLRRERGKKEMRIVKIPMVLAEDGKPISSSRIRSGEIDREGTIIRRV